MRIAVIGAGAIGGLVAGYLKLKGEEVFLVGHSEAVRLIKANGLRISGVRGEFKVEIPIAGKLNAPADLIILATKMQDLEAAVKANQPFFRGAVVLTAQNGVSADDIVALTVPKERIVSSIVMFGSTSLEPGKITHHFDGSWIIGKPFVPNDAALIKVSAVLNRIFPVLVSEEIKGMKMLKVFVNANNCIPALLGVSMQEAFSDVQISGIAMAVWKEGLAVVKNAGVTLSSLPDFPLERLEKLTSLPLAEAAKIYSGIMRNLSKEPLYGSLLQSIKRGKPSEVDYINGEFVLLAKQCGAAAVLNQKLVEMVHQVEGKKGFFTKDELVNETRELLPG